MSLSIDLAEEYKLVHAIHISFLQQMSKLAWVKSCDENSKLFHSTIKARRLHNTFYGIADVNDNWVDSLEEVNKAFLQYYIGLLGTTRENSSTIQQAIVRAGQVLNED